MTNVRSDAGPLHLRWQPTLLSALGDAPAVDPTFAAAHHVALDDTAWVEHVPGWVDAAETLFADVVDCAPWEHRTVAMYDRMVEEPRLTAWYGTALRDAHAPPVFGDIIEALGGRYDRAFDSVGAALYRDGRDSVAWHGDRVDPALVEPIVAIVSLGSARTLRMRPRWKRGESTPFHLLPGDLFVMGGSTQETWQHSVPKVKRAGARISVQFRHSA
jgi:alkylated DNA repair dioxygenase AlkB